MIQNYLKTAWRNNTRHKTFSLINILGLAIGFSAFFIIVNYVANEFNFDAFHQKKERIYRIESRFYENGELTDDWATSAFGYGSAIKKEIPGVEEMVRLPVNQLEKIVRYKDMKLRENTVTYAEPSFFKVFDYSLLKGDKNTALSQPNTVVITQRAAKKFFANENPMGKRLVFAGAGQSLDCEVTGLLQDFPSNSHISFDYIISYSSLPPWLRDFWYSHETYTYVLLQPGVPPSKIEKAFPALAEKYKTDEALRNKRWEVALTPLTAIHLNPQKNYERETKGSKNALTTLLIIAVVVLVSAWINYINLTIARSVGRAKEIGVRKVLGAQRGQLTRQFLMESCVINIMALLLAVLIVFFSYPLFSRFIGRETLLLLLQNPLYVTLMAAFLLTGVFLSGFYPSFVMAAITPSLILKGKYSNSRRGGFLQKALVVFQFASALFLISGLLIVRKQIHFMQRQDLQVNMDNTIVMKYPVADAHIDSSVQLFAEKLKTLPGLKGATVAGSVPGMEVAMFASNAIYGTQKRENKLYEMLTVDYGYIPFFGLKMMAGRPFSKDFGDDKNKLVVNEEAVSRLGISTAAGAIGKKVWLEGEQEPVEIIGVVKNWHQRGLNTAYTPLMLIMNGKIGWVPPRFIAVKTGKVNMASALSTIKKEWGNYFPQSSFDAFFLDSYFNEQYKAEQKFSAVISFFTVIAFVISFMGLWALSAFAANKRVSEIGIRKVYGAGVPNILMLLTKNILLWVGISFLIAVPCSYLAMSRWLSHFPFRTAIDAGIFIAGGTFTLAVALSTVIWQSWKVANQSPVKSIRAD